MKLIERANQYYANLDPVTRSSEEYEIPAYRDGLKDGISAALLLARQLRPLHTGFGILIHELENLINGELDWPEESNGNTGT